MITQLSETESRIYFSTLIESKRVRDMLSEGVILQEDGRKYNPNSETKMRQRYIDPMMDGGLLEYENVRKTPYGFYYKAKPEVIYAFIRESVYTQEEFDYVRNKIESMMKSDEWKKRLRGYLSEVPRVKFLDVLMSQVFCSQHVWSLLKDLLGPRVNWYYPSPRPGLEFMDDGKRLPVFDLVSFNFFYDYYIRDILGVVIYGLEDDFLKENAAKSISRDIYYSIDLWYARDRTTSDLSRREYISGSRWHYEKERVLEGISDYTQREFTKLIEYVESVPDHRVMRYIGDEWLQIVYNEFGKIFCDERNSKKVPTPLECAKEKLNGEVRDRCERANTVLESGCNVLKEKGVDVTGYKISASTQKCGEQGYVIRYDLKYDRD